MFDADQPGSSRQTTPFPETYGGSGLDRLWAACVAESSTGSAAEPTSEMIKSYLDVHLLVWDLASLHEVFPHVTRHLEARYAVERNGETITILYTDEHREPETFDTDDLRPVVSILLACEFQAALEREGCSIDFERRTG